LDVSSITSFNELKFIPKIEEALNKWFNLLVPYQKQLIIAYIRRTGGLPLRLRGDQAMTQMGEFNLGTIDIHRGLAARVDHEDFEDKLLDIIGHEGHHLLSFIQRNYQPVPEDQREQEETAAINWVLHLKPQGLSASIGGVFGSSEAGFVKSALDKLGLSGKEKIADIGSGTGDFVLAAARLYPQAEITGIELSSQNLAISEDIRARAGIENARFLNLDVLSDEVDYSEFDVLYIYNPIRAAGDAKDFYSNLAAKLAAEMKPGARLISMIPDWLETLTQAPYEGLFSLEDFGLYRVYKKKDVAVVTIELEQTGVKIKFGTSGWRGQLGKNFVIANIRRGVQGVADYYNDQIKEGYILIGFDPREGNEEFAKDGRSDGLIYLEKYLIL